MLYLANEWDTLELEGLKGGVQIVSQGRHSAPYFLVYALDIPNQVWNYEIFSCPDLTLADLAERPKSILRARSNQRAVDLVNQEHDSASADMISDLATGSRAGGSRAKMVFKGSHNGSRTPEFMQQFLQATVKEVLRERVWKGSLGNSRPNGR